ncbi:unnamed protein product [Arabis nemorensis]|uniref:EF-hand domain-containing protein n=1 Tax=Arabis nemorensis TaxID=586526 RepID=A0A565CE23_9BRAS|nr:unnamed protein product [Arabis nemorensis]
MVTGAHPPSGSSDYGGYGSQSGHGGYGAPPPPHTQGSFGSPFASLAFLSRTNPNIVACLQAADQDGSGFIDDKELQGALSLSPPSKLSGRWRST